MSALNRKMLRDFWSLRGQVLAIVLVIASGVATYILSFSVYDALANTQSTFYQEARFADVFASLKRAPELLRERIASIPGVGAVETRVVAAARLEVPNFNDPVSAQILSLPDESEPQLNQIVLRGGRKLQFGHDSEVIIHEAFAEAHGFHTGDRLYAIINGRRRELTIVGIALSPDTIYQLAPGSLVPDFKSFAVLWMSRDALEAAYDMERAFNHAAVSLTRDGNSEDVIRALDDLLAPYGGLGAYPRKEQTSHRYLSEEFKQLQQMGVLFPAIFLSVSAFLLNVVVSRLVATQRDQVAILKAFGYSNAAIVTHYLKLVSMMVFIGWVVGIFGGVWLGRGMSSMYMNFYRFPYMLYRLTAPVAIQAGSITLLAAAAGTLFAVLRAARLAPAEAMQPPKPAAYRISIVERLGLRRILSQPTRMIIRNIERRPVKSLLTILGTSMACGILVLGGFWNDSIDSMVDIQFKLAQREDMSITFVEPVSLEAVHSLESIPGVEYVEASRSVPVRLRNQYRSYRTSIQGFPQNGDLRRVFDTNLDLVRLPADGLVLTDHLANLLHLKTGDLVTLEVLEGARPVRQIPVTGTIREFVGVSAYMERAALNRLMHEGGSISAAFLEIAPGAEDDVFRQIKEMPRVAGTTIRSKMLRNFYEIVARQMLTFAFFNTILAATIAFGVVYNSTRIALSERMRELASLRVLGFTRGEIAYILLGELSVLILAAIPIGFFIGYGLGSFMVSRMTTELFRFPLIIHHRTYAFAATVILMSAVFSGILMKFRLDRLDLVSVLKTKE